MFALYEELGDGDGDGDAATRLDDEADPEALVDGVLKQMEAASSSSASCSDIEIVGVTGGVGRKFCEA